MNDIDYLKKADSYYYGEGEELSLKDAFFYYEKAAEMGNAKGKCLLGYMYREGIFASKDFDKAYSLFLEAAEDGFPMAMYNLGLCYEKGLGTSIDLEKAKEWFSLAREKGYIEE